MTASVTRRVAIALMASCVLWEAGAAQGADIDGSSDYPLVGRFEGAEIVGYQVTEYDDVTVLDGPFDPVDVSNRTGPGFKVIEGHSTLIYYTLPQERSSLEILRNYEDSMKSKASLSSSLATRRRERAFRTRSQTPGTISAIRSAIRLSCRSFVMTMSTTGSSKADAICWRDSTRPKAPSMSASPSVKAAVGLSPLCASSKLRKCRPARLSS